MLLNAIALYNYIWNRNVNIIRETDCFREKNPKKNLWSSKRQGNRRMGNKEKQITIREILPETETVRDTIQNRRLQRAGHVWRGQNPILQTVNRMVIADNPEGKIPLGRPCLRRVKETSL